MVVAGLYISITLSFSFSFYLISTIGVLYYVALVKSSSLLRVTLGLLRFTLTLAILANYITLLHGNLVDKIA